MYSIALTGHRPSKLPCGYEEYPAASQWGKRLLASLVAQIEKAVDEHGEVTVLSGMALGADQIWALAAVEAKRKGLPVKFVACVPCYRYEAKWPSASQANYRKLLEKADSVVYVHKGDYNFRCLDQRNRYMVDNADLLIAVFDGSPSGTRNCIRYAESKGVTARIFHPMDF